jgi:hypothetical protein
MFDEFNFRCRARKKLAGASFFTKWDREFRELTRIVSSATCFGRKNRHPAQPGATKVCPHTENKAIPEAIPGTKVTRPLAEQMQISTRLRHP